MKYEKVNVGDMHVAYVPKADEIILLKLISKSPNQISVTWSEHFKDWDNVDKYFDDTVLVLGEL